MKPVRIWDLVVRSFHWLLAAGFLSAFAIATLSSDDGALFPYHALLGLGLVFIVALRIVWGAIGSRWARFGALDLRLSSLFRYLRGAFGGGSSERAAGHNPATSWFVLASIAIVLGLGATGFMMARGNESVEELHEILAWSLLVLAGVHVAGIVWHRIRLRENLAVSMVTGYKSAQPEAAIASARPWSAVAFLVLTALWGSTLMAGYDRTTGRLALPLLAAPLQLTEAEEGSRKSQTKDASGNEGDEHEDEDEENDHD